MYFCMNFPEKGPIMFAKTIATKILSKLKYPYLAKSIINIIEKIKFAAAILVPHLSWIAKYDSPAIRRLKPIRAASSITSGLTGPFT